MKEEYDAPSMEDIAREADETITRKLVSDALNREYASIFLVDVDSDTYKFIYRNPDSGFADVPGGVYTDTIKEYTTRVDEEYRSEWYKMASIESIREYLSKEDRKEYVYPLSGVEKQWRRSVSHVIKRRDGVVSQFIMTYMTIDSDAAEKFRLSAEVKKQKAQLEAQQVLLEEALARAEAANNAKSSFLFNMSHDIRTPMNAITGFTAMAKKYVEDREKVIDCLEKIDMSGQQLLTLINQVLEMSRIESGKIEFDEKPLNIKEKYDFLVTVLSAQAIANDLEFHYRLCDVVHYHIYADEAKMGQITLNITGNALKYTPAGGKIDFILTEVPCEREGYARFVSTVIDTGIGMSKEFLDRIYDPFSREKSSTVSNIQGTGLGMSIVKNIVDLMGGKISVQSEQGKGTRFDITVDFRIAEENKEETKKANNNDSLVGRRILLVEDNELNREIAADILTEAGMLVETAENGRAAVDVLNLHGAQYFDFILMDIQMPVMDGYEATRVIRRQMPDLKAPIIALSANAFEEDKKKSLEAGMNEHIAKPIDVEKLKETLARFLR